jgi:catechol 2,3-dioxygenase-like lactoylglutathione lyase family enzyme
MSRAALFAFLAASASAQIMAPNQSGVAMGHLHYTVKDVEANKKFWITLGGAPVKVDSTEAVRFPGVLILLTQGNASAGTDGSVVNHVAFRVQSLAKLEAAGVKTTRTTEFAGIAYTYSPEGERIEMFDDGLATNIGFTLDPGFTDDVAERHNRPMTAPIVSHHIHLYVPADDVVKAKAWYQRLLGATPGKRWRYDAVDVPGINLNFSAAPNLTAPTKGRRLDHIGFEVQNLEIFSKRLVANGLKLDAPYTKRQAGRASAFLTDPWGTYIELTEGLRGR